MSFIHHLVFILPVAIHKQLSFLKELGKIKSNLISIIIGLSCFKNVSFTGVIVLNDYLYLPIVFWAKTKEDGEKLSIEKRSAIQDQQIRDFCYEFF